MVPDLIYNELTPYLQDTVKFIAAAAAGGVIGNRVDNWFMSLFYHQRRRIIDWIDTWNPDIKDIQVLMEDDKLRILFSKVFADISNEISDTKVLLWPAITDSIIRRQEIAIDKKQYFISLFNRFDAFTLKYLASLYFERELDYFQVFNESGDQPDNGSTKHAFFLGQLQCVTTGLTDITRVQPSKLFLTQLGKEFVDFISDESKNKLKFIMDN